MNSKSDYTVSNPDQLSLLELHVNAARHQLLRGPPSPTLAANPTSRGINRQKLLHVLDEALKILDDDDETIFESSPFPSRGSRKQ
eukprot:scaffold6154_cov154-Amphora_coffeaeformis.AAC.2